MKDHDYRIGHSSYTPYVATGETPLHIREASNIPTATPTKLERANARIVELEAEVAMLKTALGLVQRVINKSHEK